MRSRHGVFIFSLLLVLIPALGQGQQLDTSFDQTAPPAPVGSGARAMGTGGAYIAITDDATAANWNPAGLIQLVKPEVSFAANYEQRRITGESAGYGSVDYISGVLPFNLGGVNMVVSANYQRKWDFTFDSDFGGQVNSLPGDTQVLIFTYDPAGTDFGQFATVQDSYGVSGAIDKVGSLEALSPAAAIQVTPEFALGFTYNFWSDRWLSRPYQEEYRERQTAGRTVTNSEIRSFDVNPSCVCTDSGGVVGPCDDTTYRVITNPECLTNQAVVVPGATVGADRDPLRVTIEEEIEMEGQNFNVGFLWRVTPRFTLGGVYRSEFTVDMDREVIYRKQIDLNPVTRYKWEDEMEMRMPASYGLGAAFRYNDQLSLALDLSFIEWSRFQIAMEDDSKISPVNGLPVKIADIDTTVTARLGAEYLILNPKYIVPIRAGVFYDPEPARGHPDPYYGVALGTGLVYEPVVLDLSYWYRFGNDVTLYTEYDRASGRINEVEGDAHRQMVMLSAVVHLK